MTEKGKLFFEKLSKDEKLKAELTEIIKGAKKDTYFEKTVAFAKANGFELEKADICADKEELAPEELEMVTGGNPCMCIYIGTDTCFCTYFGAAQGGVQSGSTESAKGDDGSDDNRPKCSHIGVV